MNVASVMSAEQARIDALLKKDLEKLRGLLAPSLSYIHSNGKVDDLSAVLNKVSTPFRYLSMVRRELNVEIYGDQTAVMTGFLDVEFTSDDGAPIQAMTGMLTQVWVAQGEDVRLTAYHVSKVV